MRALFFALLAALLPISALAQSGPYTPQAVPDFVQSGQLTYVNGAVTLLLNGQSSCTVNLIGNWTGTIAFQGTSDNVTWQNLQLTPYPGGSSSSSTTANNLYVGACVGLSGFRAYSTSWTAGTAYVTLHGANGSGASVGASGGGGGGGNVSILQPADLNGYVEVNCKTGCGGGGSGAPLPGGSSTAAAANQAIGIQAYDGAANLVPLQQTAGALNVRVNGGVSIQPFTGGATGVATGANQGVAIHAYNGTTLDAVHSFTFGGTPGWIASASTMYDPTSGLNASVTAGGTNGTNAIAMQGITNGVPIIVAQPAGTSLHANIDNFPTNQGTGQNSSGTNQFMPQCDQSVPVNVSTAADVQLVALTSGKQIHVCAYNFMGNGASNVSLESGTGANCATGQAAITGTYPLQAQAGISAGGGNGQLFATPVSTALCIKNGSAQLVGGLITYGVWYNGRLFAVHSLADLELLMRAFGKK